METERSICNGRHDGHAVKRLRLEQNLAQEALASQVELSQKDYARIEAMRVIDDKLLAKIAKALDVTPEIIKNMDEEVSPVVIENIENKIEGTYGKVINAATGVSNNESNTDNYNPLEEIIRVNDQKSKLYEELLEVERANSKALQQRVEQLEEQLACNNNGTGSRKSDVE